MISQLLHSLRVAWKQRSATGQTCVQISPLGPDYIVVRDSKDQTDNYTILRFLKKDLFVLFGAVLGGTLTVQTKKYRSGELVLEQVVIDGETQFKMYSAREEESFLLFTTQEIKSFLLGAQEGTWYYLLADVTFEATHADAMATISEEGIENPEAVRPLLPLIAKEKVSLQAV